MKPIHMSIAALFVIVKNLSQLSYLSIGERLNNLEGLHATEYYSVIQEMTVLVRSWVDFRELVC